MKSFRRYAPFLAKVGTLGRIGGYILEIRERLLHRKSFEHKSCQIPGFEIITAPLKTNFQDPVSFTTGLTRTCASFEGSTKLVDTPQYIIGGACSTFTREGCKERNNEQIGSGVLKMVYACKLWNYTRYAGRGNFVVVGLRKSLFSGAVIGPNSLFCFTPITCNCEICAAHRRSLPLQQQQPKTPRAQQYTSLLVPCAHGKLNAKHYRTAPKPETHITRQVVEKKLRSWRENRE